MAAVCAAVLWPAVEQAAIAGWFAAVALITAVRYALVRAYRAAERAPAAALAWENRFAAGGAAMGAAWGILATLVDPASYTLQVFVAFTIGGMAIGAKGVLAPSRRAFLWFVVPMLGAQAAEFLWLGGDLYVAMGLMVAIFLGAVVRVFRDLNRTVTQNIERGIVNERLVAEQRGLFDTATVGIAFFRGQGLRRLQPGVRADPRVDARRAPGRVEQELVPG